MKLYEGIVQKFDYISVIEDQSIGDMVVENWKSTLMNMLMVINLKLDDIFKRQKDYCIITIQLDSSREVKTFVLEDPVGFLNIGDHVLILEKKILGFIPQLKTIGVSRFPQASVVFKIHPGNVLTLASSSKSLLKSHQISKITKKGLVYSLNSFIKTSLRTEKAGLLKKNNYIDKRFETYFFVRPPQSSNVPEQLVMTNDTLFKILSENTGLFRGWEFEGVTKEELILPQKVVKDIVKKTNYRIIDEPKILIADDVVMKSDKGIIELSSMSDREIGEIEGMAEDVYPVAIKGEVGLLEEIKSFSDYEILHMFFKTVIEAMSKFDFQSKHFVHSTRSWRHTYFNGFILKGLLDLIHKGKLRNKSIREKIKEMADALNSIKAEVADIQTGLKKLKKYRVQRPVMIDTPLVTAFLVKTKNDDKFRVVLSYPIVPEATEIPIRGNDMKILRYWTGDKLTVYRTQGNRYENIMQNVKVTLTTQKYPIYPRGFDVEDEYRAFFAFLMNPEIVSAQYLSEIRSNTGGANLSKNFGMMFHKIIANVLTRTQKAINFIGPYVYQEGRLSGNFQSGQAIFILNEYPDKYNAGTNTFTLKQKGRSLYEVVK